MATMKKTVATDELAKPKKYKRKEEKYIHPDHEAILRYQKEIAYWEEVYKTANDAHDWDTRNTASCRLLQKKQNLGRLIILVGQEKIKRWKIKC
jgi:hypothetical protein